MEAYVKVKAVGRGAFGTVHLVKRKSDNREIILKQIPVEQLSQGERQASVSEVKVLAMLSHPNIIEYYDSFTHEQSLVIAMEYAAGGTLAEFLEKRGGHLLKEEDIAHMLAQVVLSLQVVHAKQVLHRDLKTQNILLSGDKNGFDISRNLVKIGDFGISKVLASKSKAISVVGTPCYISPELCEGKPYNQKSDIWSLGCILYEMCALKRAFEAPTLPALVLKIMRGSYTPLSSHWSASLNELLASMLALEPSARPTIGQISAHPWIAPAICKLATSLGALPCVARPPRPPSPSTAEDMGLASPMASRSVSPFQREKSSLLLVWKGEANKSEQLRLSSGSTNLSTICMASQHYILATNKDGKVFEWRKHGEWSKPSLLNGLSGISITSVAAFGDRQTCMLLTDRGIVMTKGRGEGGLLGHGDFEDLKLPKIVETLLGREVTQVACSAQHVIVLTSEGEVFGWGKTSSLGLKGQSSRGKSYTMTSSPKKIAVEGHFIVGASCGHEGTALISDSGQVLVAGKNEGNRFGLKEQRFTDVFTKMASPSDGAMWFACLVGQTFIALVSVKGELFMSGNGESDRKLVNVNHLKLPERDEKIEMVSSSETASAFAVATDCGHIYIGVYKKDKWTLSPIPSARGELKHVGVSKTGLSLSALFN